MIKCVYMYVCMYICMYVAYQKKNVYMYVSMNIINQLC